MVINQAQDQILLWIRVPVVKVILKVHLMQVPVTGPVTVIKEN